MSKLPLSTFQKKYTHHINRDLSMHTFWNFWTEKYGYELDFDVWLESKQQNLQRPLVWTLIQKQQLILTILRDMKLPNFVVVQICKDDRNDRLLKVIDGKQRFNAVFDYFDGKYPIVVNDAEYYFDDLDEDAQRQIKFYSPRFDVHYHYEYDVKEMITDDIMIDIFERVNFLGTPQDIEHLNNLKNR